MKFRTTQKAVKESYKNIISVPYCAIQELLRFQDPIAYTARREGWGSDIYVFESTALDCGSVALSTGYAPFGNVVPRYDTLKKYDNKALGIMNDNTLSFPKKVYKTNKLLLCFLNEVTK